ncbi:hypothetical protein DFH11DRAFT_1547570 [Phellopilus nigrolimitatus]|nr:hypothetical protein DFH11DRAFT_1547570 [Phellopilus nigrolimitatus]
MSPIDISVFEPNSLFLVFTEKSRNYGCRLALILLTSEKLNSDRKIFMVGSTRVPNYRGVWTKTAPLTPESNNGIVKNYEHHTTVKFNKLPLNQEQSMSVFNKLRFGVDPDFKNFPKFPSQDDFNFGDI